MPLPVEPRAFGPDAIDVPSTLPPCKYDQLPIGPSACFISPNVLVSAVPAIFAVSGLPAAPVKSLGSISPDPITQIACLATPPVPRIIKEGEFAGNQTVYINGQLVATRPGARADLVKGGSPRGIIGPTIWPRVIISAYTPFVPGGV